MRPNKFLFLVTAVFVALFLTSAESSAQNADNGIYVPRGQVHFPDDNETNSVFSQKYLADPEKIAALKKNVYEIVVQTEDPYSIYFGSGIVFDNNGQPVVITANHITTKKIDGEKTIHARDYTGRIFRCKISASLQKNDLAILWIEEPERIRPETVVKSINKVDMNEMIYACGYYGGISFVKMGEIIGFQKKIKTEGGFIYNIVESDAQIGHGFSGGPVLNEKNELVGIIVAMNPDAGLSDFSSFENIREILNIKLSR